MNEYDFGIDKLNLPVRTRNALISNEIYEINDLTALNKKELLKLPGIAERGANIIIEKLGMYNNSIKLSPNVFSNLSLGIKEDYLKVKIDCLEEEMVQLKQLIYPLIEVIESVKKLLKT